MKMIHDLPYVKDFDPTDKKLIEEVKEWINSNMMVMDQSYVWRVGIATSEDIMKIAGKVRSDFECKHFKYWRSNSFKSALKTISRLTKYPFIFKSPMNKYTGKGRYIFTYKSPCPSKSLFYHTLHY